MNDKKTMVRVFTIADYEEEEAWLRKQHQNGWKLKRTVAPCFFIFEKCKPQDVVYRLDYKNNKESGDYFQLFNDYGWEYFNRCAGWLYFRKATAATDSEQDREIFSDDSSRLDMIDHIFKTRMLPLLIIFFSCLLPQFFRSVEESGTFMTVTTVFFSALILLYVFLIIYCGVKLRKKRKKYRRE